LSPGRVRSDVADVDVPDESAGREAADPGEDVERGDLAEVRKRYGRVDRVAEPVLAERRAEVEVTKAGQNADRSVDVFAQVSQGR
jgi:hypothetical protein